MLGCDAAQTAAVRDALLADLVQELAACGAGVVELTPHTKTLEEIFLSLTSEEAD